MKIRRGYREFSAIKASPTWEQTTRKTERKIGRVRTPCPASPMQAQMPSPRISPLKQTSQHPKIPANAPWKCLTRPPQQAGNHRAPVSAFAHEALSFDAVAQESLANAYRKRFERQYTPFASVPAKMARRNASIAPTYSAPTKLSTAYLYITVRHACIKAAGLHEEQLQVRTLAKQQLALFGPTLETSYIKDLILFLAPKQRTFNYRHAVPAGKYRTGCDERIGY